MRLLSASKLQRERCTRAGASFIHGAEQGEEQTRDAGTDIVLFLYSPLDIIIITRHAAFDPIILCAKPEGSFP